MPSSTSDDATLIAFPRTEPPFSAYEQAVIGALRAKRAQDEMATASPPPRSAQVYNVLQTTLDHLPDAIVAAGLDDRAEFHSLFQFMTGLGLDHSELGAVLKVGRFTISRYANGDSAPPTAATRRGVLVDTYRLLCRKAEAEELPFFEHFRVAKSPPAANCDEGLVTASDTTGEAGRAGDCAGSAQN